MNERATLEVAVDRIEDGEAAAAAGADRIEFCASLHEHGLTPDPAALRELKARVRVPVVALVRPSPGPFVADAASCALSTGQAESLLRAGADGLAFGYLTPEGEIDEVRCREMVRLCAGRDPVFHRAFDLCRDQGDALERLIAARVRRVLASGITGAAAHEALGVPLPKWTVSPGSTGLGERLALLRALTAQARGRIAVIACGGLRASNAAPFIDDAGCDELHSSCRVALSFSSSEAAALRRAAGLRATGLTPSATRTPPAAHDP